MTKKIPNFLSNQRLVVSNFLDRNEGLIIGDTKKVLDIKNQYLIETFKFTILKTIIFVPLTIKVIKIRYLSFKKFLE